MKTNNSDELVCKCRRKCSRFGRGFDIDAVKNAQNAAITLATILRDDMVSKLLLLVRVADYMIIENQEQEKNADDRDA